MDSKSPGMRHIECVRKVKSSAIAIYAYMAFDWNELQRKNCFETIRVTPVFGTPLPWYRFLEQCAVLRHRIIPRREPKFEIRRAVSANARHRKIEFIRIYDPLWIRGFRDRWDRRFTARRVRSKAERVRGK